MSSWDTLNKEAEKQAGLFKATHTTQRMKQEAQEKGIDPALYRRLKEGGVSSENISTLSPQKVKKREVISSMLKPVGGLFNRVNRESKAAFQFLSAPIAAGMALPKGGATPKQAFKEAVKSGVETSENKDAEGLFGASIRLWRGATTAASAPIAAGMALPKGGATPKGAFFEALNMAKEVSLDDKVSIERDAVHRISDEYMKFRGIGSYGENEVTLGDKMAFGTFMVFNIMGDIGAGAVAGTAKSVRNIGKAAKEVATFKKVGEQVVPLAKDTSFVKGTTSKIEVKVADDLKIVIRPKEQEIVIEGYQRRFGATKIVPEGAVPTEIRELVPTLERITGSQIIGRIENGNLILRPVKGVKAAESVPLLEAPKPVKAGEGMVGKGFTATEKVDPKKIEETKLLTKYRNELQKYIQNPTPKTMETVLRTKESLNSLRQEQKGGFFESVAKMQEVKPKKPAPDILKIDPKNKEQIVYTGQKGKVRKETIKLEGKKVKEIEGDQRILTRVKTYPEADQKLIDKYSGEFDYVKVSHPTMPNKADELLDLKTGVWYSPDNNVAQVYAMSSRGAKYDKGIAKPPTPTKKSSPSTSTTPTPVQSDGAIRQSKVFKKTQDTMKNELGGDVNYNQMSIDNDIARAAERVAKDFDESLDIARGLKGAPDDTTLNILTATVAEQALKNGDLNLFAELTTRRSLTLTRAGQEIVSERGRVLAHDTAGGVKRVIQNKMDNLGGAKKFMERLDNEKVAELTKINKRAAQIRSAQDIIDSLIC